MSDKKTKEPERIVYINRCCDCPSQEPFTWRCSEKKRDLPDFGCPIPDWCPRDKKAEPRIDGMTKTYGGKKVHAIISEGKSDYVIRPDLESAEEYAKEQASKHSDEHFIILAHVCGFYLGEKQRAKRPYAKASEPDDTIEDGFGSVWPKRCPECGDDSMFVCRPGKAQC